MIKRILTISFFTLVFLTLKAQQDIFEVELEWHGIKEQELNEKEKKSYSYFQGAVYENPESGVPYYFQKMKWNFSGYSPEIQLYEMIFESLDNKEEDFINKRINVGKEPEYSCHLTTDNKVECLIIKVLPYRKNPLTQKTEKLVSFKYQLNKSSKKSISAKTKTWNFSNKSVLATGKWYKFSTQQNGIYRITYSDLLAMGVDVKNLNPQNISIFGNGAGMLPETNSVFRYDDLEENSIFIFGEGDGKFDPNDFILFYGQSPAIWELNPSNNLFEHKINYFTDFVYYFLTTDPNIGSKKRVAPENVPSTPPTKVIDKFLDRQFSHKELENFIKSGKIWLGEKFSSLVSSYNYSFVFPNIIQDSSIVLKTSLYYQSTISSIFTINANGLTRSIPLSGFPSSYYGIQAVNYIDLYNYKLSSPTVNVNISYNHPSSNSYGWLNYIEISAYRSLSFTGSQMLFRSLENISQNSVSEFQVSNSDINTKIWDVSDPLNPKEVQSSLIGNTLIFKSTTNFLKEFVAFNFTNFLHPEYRGEVKNQNLHGFEQQDYIIVSHPLFFNEANRLAEFHRNKNNLKVKVVLPEQIYNEFSSGSQDPVAIRSFMKMFYDRASSSSDAPKYLLLFGDGSYDNKNRINGNTNFIVTHQSLETYNLANSYVSDDFFGFLDDNENGYNIYEGLDIGIGRFPVKSELEARIVVDKVIRYSSKQDLVPNSNNIVSNYGDWKNTVCFVADDEDGNVYLTDTEVLTNKLKNNYPTINIDKIYLDAYPQVFNSGGQRYPEVNKAINQRVEKGVLIMNYIGHGGELGWAHERVLEISDINSWNNTYNMPLFFTATCEFSRFDDPERTSAGELVLLTSKGGGIALLTTSRVAYQNSNMGLIDGFFSKVFKKENGNYPTLGDLIKYSKNSNANGIAIKNFVLLGDPAMRLAYPKYNVLTNSINNKPANISSDTLSAFSKVTIKGMIADEDSNIVNFNGVLYPTVFDKPTKVTTLGNDYPYTVNFELLKSILFKGKAKITNGNFEFSFIVPKDIAYNFGAGKISYYAKNDTSDANGYYNRIIVGGIDNQFIFDEIGPEISLFMNDTTFINGGTTNENPVLLAKISDNYGINTVGNGIGHDLSAYLDNNNQPIILNDFFSYEIDSYLKGSVYYPFFNLSDGHHSIRFKAWDISNNSSSATLDFIVTSSEKIVISNLLNYPNPFSDLTYFTFKHNHPNELIDVEISIFDIKGQLVKVIKEKISTEGFNSAPIEWNGSSDTGSSLPRGVYVYKVKLKAQNGIEEYATNKLVFLK